MNEEILTLEKQRNRLKAFKGFAAAFIVFSTVMLICCIPFIEFPNRSYLNYSNYKQIKEDMTYSEVVTILDGHEGELQSTSQTQFYKIVYYQWQNKQGTKVIVVGFLNGKVHTKSQAGLK